MLAIMVKGSSSEDTPNAVPAPPTVRPLLGMFIMAIRGGGTISCMPGIMATGSSSEDTPNVNAVPAPPTVRPLLGMFIMAMEE